MRAIGSGVFTKENDWKAGRLSLAEHMLVLEAMWGDQAQERGSWRDVDPGGLMTAVAHIKRWVLRKMEST